MKKKLLGFKTKAHEKFKAMTRREIALSVVIFVLIIQFFQVQSLFGTFTFLEDRDSSLVTEIGDVKESYLKIGSDLNEVRDYLRLPVNNYMDAEVEEEAGGNDDNVQLALFEYVNYLGATTQAQEDGARHKGFINELKASEPFKKFLSDENLILSELFEDGEVVTIAVKTADQLKIANITMQKDTGRLYVETAVNDSRISADDAQEFEDFVVKLVQQNKSKII